MMKKTPLKEIREEREDRGSFCIAEPGSPAWDEAWAALAAEFGDVDGWQYMGTERRDGVWAHCFRHRSLDSAQNTYRHYPATDHWK